MEIATHNRPTVFMNKGIMLDINNTLPAKNAYQLNPHGQLVEIGDWSEEAANALAAEEGVTLTEEHWAVIRAARPRGDGYIGKLWRGKVYTADISFGSFH